MRRLTTFLASCLVSASAVAQLSDIPLSNWTVPAYTAAATGGLTTMGAAPPRVFVPTDPCRIVDTRGGPGFPAGYGAPALSPGVTRTFDIRNGPCPGIPQSTAYSLNVTVVIPAGPGHLIIWSAGSPTPSASTINFTTGQTIANAAIVPANSPSGQISVVAGVSGTHLLIDINGYFTYDASSGQFFLDSTIAPVVYFRNHATTCTGTCGLEVDSDTTASGQAIGGFAINGGTNSAGVRGRHGSFSAPGSYGPAGVRGEGGGYGVLGISPIEGTSGDLVNGSGAEIAYGSLGLAFGTDPNCVGGGSCGGPWGVFAGGNIGATGTKHFLDPHPTDPSLTIAYVSLEGPEAGTYFRGRARFQNGMARIPVPEHFRLVTDAEGLTVQITPIGAMATFAVMKMDLDEIVVQGSRNVEFSYLVQGVRASFKDLVPLRRGGEFAPRSADAKIPEWLSPVQKRLLVRNGTYREDGSVNVETAHRLGWDRVWTERKRPAPVAGPD